MTLVIGRIRDCKVEIVSDSAISYGSKKSYKYETSIVENISLDLGSSFIEEKCHKIVLIGENCICGFSGDVYDCLEMIDKLKASYDSDNPKSSIEFVLKNTSASEFSDHLLIGFYHLTKPILIHFANGSFNEEYFKIIGSGSSNVEFVRDLIDISEYIGHESANALIDLWSYCGIICDLCLQHSMEKYGVSGLIIGASVGETGVVWNKSYAIIFYEINKFDSAKLVGLYLKDGIARYITTHRAIGDRINWMTSADLVIRKKNTDLQNILRVINEWDKLNEEEFKNFKESFSNSNLIFITNDSNRNRLLYIISSLSNERAKIQIVEKDTFCYDFAVESNLSGKLNAENKTLSNKIVVKFLN